MSKSSRILELMQIVYQKQSFTVTEMASELGVSYRTMLRYLEELSTNGVPLYSEPGKHGGYRLLNTHKKELPPEENTSMSDSIRIMLKPSFYVAGKVIRAPYTAFRFIQSIIQHTLQDMEQKVEELNINATNKEPIVLLKREVNDFICVVGVEVASKHDVPEGMDSISIPVQQYSYYVHVGDWNRINIEETISFAKEIIIKHALSVRPDNEKYTLVVPSAEKSTTTVYIPVN